MKIMILIDNLTWKIKYWKYKKDGGLDMAAVAGAVCGLIIGICVAKITKKRK